MSACVCVCAQYMHTLLEPKSLVPGPWQLLRGLGSLTALRLALGGSRVAGFLIQRHGFLFRGGVFSLKGQLCFHTRWTILEHLQSPADPQALSQPERPALPWLAGLSRAFQSCQPPQPESGPHQGPSGGQEMRPSPPGGPAGTGDLSFWGFSSAGRTSAVALPVTVAHCGGLDPALQVWARGCCTALSCTGSCRALSMCEIWGHFNLTVEASYSFFSFAHPL